MKFIDCPHCGMKNLDTVKICKGCRNDITAPPSEGRQAVPPAPPQKAAGAMTTEKPSKPGNAPDKGFGGLINAENDDGENDEGILAGVEVIREKDENDGGEGIAVTQSKKGVVHVKIIDAEERQGLLSDNFQRRIIPRLLQIFFAVSLLTVIAAAVIIYNIMNLPQYYNYFHMRSELTKKFPDTIVQLNVCENARGNPRLMFQIEELTAIFLNKYFNWIVLVTKVEKLPAGNLSKCSYRLAVKSGSNDRAGNRTFDIHYIKMHMNDKMADKIKKTKELSISSEKMMTVLGRIIGWRRLPDKTIEIEAYDAEIAD